MEKGRKTVATIGLCCFSWRRNSKCMQALCRVVGEVIPTRQSSSSWRKCLLGHNEGISRTSLCNLGQGGERINLSLLFLMFENLWILFAMILSPHSPPNLKTAAGISALRSSWVWDRKVCMWCLHWNPGCSTVTIPESPNSSLLLSQLVLITHPTSYEVWCCCENFNSHFS